MAFAMILSFAACGNDTPNPEQVGPDTENPQSEADKPEKEEENEAEIEELPADVSNKDYEGLVEGLGFAEAICGVAYVGFFEDPFDDDYAAIVEKQTELLEIYSFVAEIPDERFVKTDGYELYCIVPANLDCSVKVEELSMPEDTEAWEPIIGEVIYESETGEPILLKCNESDIFTNVLVTITTPDGVEKKLSPYLSLMDGSLAGINEDESELLALDFSRPEMSTEDFYTFDELINIEWGSFYYHDDGSTYVMNLSFYYDENDRKCVSFWYGLENSDIDEIFDGTVYESFDENGNWDGGYTLDMSLTGGLFYNGESYPHVCSYKFQKEEGSEDSMYAIHYGTESPFFMGTEYQTFYFFQPKG